MTTPDETLPTAASEADVPGQLPPVDPGAYPDDATPLDPPALDADEDPDSLAGDFTPGDVDVDELLGEYEGDDDE